MGAIDSILQSQRDFRLLAAEFGALVKRHKELDMQYGGGSEGRKARLGELRRLAGGTLNVGASVHGDFDSRHELQIEGERRRWKFVQDCPDCNRIVRERGLGALQEEFAQILAWQEELSVMAGRGRELRALCEALVTSINSQAQQLGLPGFEAKITGEGFASVQRLTSAKVGGEEVLNSGRIVSYGTTRVAFDDAESLIAYQEGGGMWTLMRAAAKPKITSDRGWYSVLREGGTIEVMLDRNGEFTNDYPHVHVIHDEPRNEIRVVASRGPRDHSAPEILPGDASGNEVNAAVERAIRLL